MDRCFQKSQCWLMNHVVSGRFVHFEQEPGVDIVQDQKEKKGKGMDPATSILTANFLNMSGRSRLESIPWYRLNGPMHRDW